MSSASEPAARRVQLQADTREVDIELIADESNIYRWTGYLQVRARSRLLAQTQHVGVGASKLMPPALLQGPVGTPYEGGVFQVAVNVPQQYPLTPPAVKFVTKARRNPYPRRCCPGHAGAAPGSRAAPPRAGVPPQRALEGAPPAWAPFGCAKRCVSCGRRHSACFSCSALWLTRCRAQTGEICLDILKSAWSPAWTLQSVCRAILSLMAHAAPDSPLNCDAGNLLRAGDVMGYNSMARCYTVEYAIVQRPPRGPPS